MIMGKFFFLLSSVVVYRSPVAVDLSSSQGVAYLAARLSSLDDAATSATPISRLLAAPLASKTDTPFSSSQSAVTAIVSIIQIPYPGRATTACNPPTKPPSGDFSLCWLLVKPFSRSPVPHPRSCTLCSALRPLPCTALPCACRTHIHNQTPLPVLHILFLLIHPRSHYNPAGPPVSLNYRRLRLFPWQSPILLLCCNSCFFLSLLGAFF